MIPTSWRHLVPCPDTGKEGWTFFLVRWFAAKQHGRSCRNTMEAASRKLAETIEIYLEQKKKLTVALGWFITLQ